MKNWPLELAGNWPRKDEAKKIGLAKKMAREIGRPNSRNWPAAGPGRFLENRLIRGRRPDAAAGPCPAGGHHPLTRNRCGTVAKFTLPCMRRMVQNGTALGRQRPPEPIFGSARIERAKSTRFPFSVAPYISHKLLPFCFGPPFPRISMLGARGAKGGHGPTGK